MARVAEYGKRMGLCWSLFVAIIVAHAQDTTFVNELNRQATALTYSNPEKALQTYHEVLNLYEDLNDTLNMGLTLNTTANIYCQQSVYFKAVETYKRAVALLEGTNYTHALQQTYEGLSMCHTKLGNFDEAIVYQKLQLGLDSTILPEAIAERVNLLIDQKLEVKEEEQLIEREEENQELAFLAQKRTLQFLVVGFLLVLGVVTGGLYMAVRKAREARKAAELEQKALRAQMNPHFIFNSLNAIQDMYVNGETDLANNYMGDFSELMRKILDNSSKDRITVKEELDTLRLYLQLEQIRCNDMLQYRIETDEHLDQLNTYMAPLVIQPFVENAIWHGILPKKEPGLVTVKLHGSHGKLICTIEDDGVGISNSSGQKDKGHVSKGMGLTEQRLGTRIKAGNRPDGGTRITLTIPT